MRTVTTVALAVFGFALVALSWGACNVVILGEQYSSTLALLFFGGLIAGGASLAAAVVRIRRPRTVAAEMDVARGLGVAGMALALGAAGIGWAMSVGSWAASVHWTGALLIGAVFVLGAALTIGALGLLAWAANGPHSNR